jgi:hypothetical protein
MTAAPPLLLGLVGPIGAGKDTAAAYLRDHYAFVSVAFADPVRDMLGALVEHVDGSGAWLTDRALKELPMPVLGRSYRELARSLGTAWGRELLGADWWVRIADHKLRNARTCGDNLVVTDVRHLNEAAWLRAHGGRLVAITRDGHAFNSLDHDSELQAACIECEHVISNSTTPAHLHDQLDLVVERLRRATTTTEGAHE